MSRLLSLKQKLKDWGSPGFVFKEKIAILIRINLKTMFKIIRSKVTEDMEVTQTKRTRLILEHWRDFSQTK